MKLAAEHEYGIYAKTVKNNPDISDEDKKYIFDQLKANFEGECSEVGMYLCMAKKKKEGTITPEELKEQDKLRKEYIRLFREGFKSQLKTIKVVDEKGNDITPEKLKREKLKN